jgi:hypothetical protein
VIKGKSDTSLKRIKVIFSIESKNISYVGFSEDKSIPLEPFFHLFFLSWLDTDSTRYSLFEGGEKHFKLLFFSLEEGFSEIVDEARIDGQL